jgi:hypothetical protein
VSGLCSECIRHTSTVVADHHKHTQLSMLTAETATYWAERRAHAGLKQQQPATAGEAYAHFAVLSCLQSQHYHVHACFGGGCGSHGGGPQGQDPACHCQAGTYAWALSCQNDQNGVERSAATARHPDAQFLVQGTISQKLPAMSSWDFSLQQARFHAWTLQAQTHDLQKCGIPRESYTHSLRSPCILACRTHRCASLPPAVVLGVLCTCWLPTAPRCQSRSR